MSNLPALAVLGGVWGAFTGTVGLGLMLEATGPWGRFVTTRIWLAAHRAAPLRLMAFLNQAHQRGLLIQIGGYYQFPDRPAPCTTAGHPTKMDR